MMLTIPRHASRVTRCENSKSRITLLGPVTHHADNLGPISDHRKPLCYPVRTVFNTFHQSHGNEGKRIRKVFLSMWTPWFSRLQRSVEPHCWRGFEVLPRYSRDKATPWTARRLNHWSFAKGYFLNNSLVFSWGEGRCCRRRNCGYLIIGN